MSEMRKPRLGERALEQSAELITAHVIHLSEVEVTAFIKVTPTVTPSREQTLRQIKKCVHYSE